MSNIKEVMDSLKWRYAAKQYDTSKKLSEEQLEAIKEALRLAPSSSGFQPWKFVHIGDNQELRQQLKAAGYNQLQFEQASDIFILASYKSVDENYVNKLVANFAEAQGVAEDTLQGLRDYLLGVVKSMPDPVVMENWLARQVYIPLGMALAVAAELHIDASPMEGFDSKAFDKILGLDQQNLASRAVLGVGFRSENDARQHQAKARWSQSEVFIEK